MGSPAKPFACTAADCSMRFTNEDHLTVHSRKHDLELQLAMGHKAAVFPADQTPTPTRFIRNCEEVGLFQDLQSVNPFDEGFKRAMETNKSMLISLDGAIALATSDDALHTPHVFPSLSEVADTNLFSPASKTISRLSSEDAQIVKHLESSVAAKMTNSVSIKDNNDAQNTITINRHVEIRQADYSTVVSSNDPNLIRIVVKNNEKDINVVKKDVLLTDAGKIPVISQKSLDFAIDSLTSNIDGDERSDTVKDTEQDILKSHNNKNQCLIDTMKKNLKRVLKKAETVKNEQVRRRGKKRKSEVSDITAENYEVLLKLPSGELLHMKSDKVKTPPSDAKQKLKNALENKLKTQIESEIRTDIENKISTELLGKYILKVKDPETINAIGPTENENQIFFQIAPNTLVRDDQILLQLAQKKSTVPIVVAQPNVLIPVKKIGIPMLKHVAPNKPKRGRRKRVILKVDSKTVHHKPDCDILHKVGTSCNLNCAENVINLANIALKPNSDPAINSKAPVLLATPDKDEKLNKRPTVQSVIQVSSDESLDTTTIADATVPNADILADMEMRRCRNSEGVGSDSDTTPKGDSRGSEAAEDKMRRESRVEAVRRYRSRQRNKLKSLVEQNRAYEEERNRLRRELLKTKTVLAALKKVFVDHCTVCPSAEKIRQRFSGLLHLEVDEDHSRVN